MLREPLVPCLGGESGEEGFDAINEQIAQRLGLLLASGENVEGVGETVVPAQTTLDVAGGDTRVLGGVDEAALAADLGL